MFFREDKGAWNTDGGGVFYGVARIILALSFDGD